MKWKPRPFRWVQFLVVILGCAGCTSSNDSGTPEVQSPLDINGDASETTPDTLEETQQDVFESDVNDVQKPDTPPTDSVVTDTQEDIIEQDSAEEDVSPGPPCEVVVPPEAEWRTGPQEDGSFLLPGGRALERVGPWLEIGGFPSDIIGHPTLGLSYLTVAGRNKRELVVLDVVTQEERQRLSRNGAFYGMEIDPDGEWLYVSGGGSYTIERYPIEEDGLLGESESLPTGGFASGMALSTDGSTLWVGHFGGEFTDPVSGVVEVDTASWEVTKELDLDAIVWDLLFLPQSQELYVSDLAGNGIYVIDTVSWAEIDQIEVPTSPAGMELNPETNEVWVAVTGADAIATVDPITRLATQWTPVTDLAWIDEDGVPLPYSNVNSLDYDPSTKRLYATRGADNAVSVFQGETMQLLGAFPTA